MFGYHKARRERKKAARARKEIGSQKEAYAAERPKQQRRQEKFNREIINERTAESAELRKKARAEGRADTEEFFKKEVEGLKPEQRSAMQYEANRGIQRSHENASRKLLGEQSQRGVVGKGGVGYAQQRDLQRMANEAEGGVHRDLDKLNSDLALKKQAAIFTGGEGNAIQSQLDKQMAVDEIQLNDERRRQRMFEDQFNRLFSRV